jgi:hypothetical protein
VIPAVNLIDVHRNPVQKLELSLYSRGTMNEERVSLRAKCLNRSWSRFCGGFGVLFELGFVRKNWGGITFYPFYAEIFSVAGLCLLAVYFVLPAAWDSARRAGWYMRCAWVTGWFLYC